MNNYLFEIFSLQNSPLPGAGLIRYTVEQAFKLFSTSEREDLESIRKDIHELNISLNSRLPQAVEKVVRKEVASKLEALDAAERNISNIR